MFKKRNASCPSARCNLPTPQVGSGSRLTEEVALPFLDYQEMPAAACIARYEPEASLTFAFVDALLLLLLRLTLLLLPRSAKTSYKTPRRCAASGSALLLFLPNMGATPATFICNLFALRALCNDVPSRCCPLEPLRGFAFVGNNSDAATVAYA